MDPMKNPCIATIFMSNIDQRMVVAQRKIVEKYNVSKIPHYSVLTDGQPGPTMEKLVGMLEEKGHDGIMFLDVDCVPLSDVALDYFFEQANQGKIIGDAQRSNHIENNQHVFCAPHNLTFRVDVYNKLGKPTFAPTQRGDVGEELTFVAEENNINVEIVMPTRFDAPPIRMAWEPNDLPPYWDLADGMPKYGIGTTFGNEEFGEMFWHMYQSFHPGQTERFLKKCEELLNG